MSLSADELQLLMAYVDGELDAEGVSRALALRDSSEEAKGLLAGLEASEVGGLLREDAEERAVAAGADAIADRVFASLSANLAASAPMLAPKPIVANDAVVPAGARPAPSIAPHATSFGAKGVLGISFALVAAAAAVVLYLQGGSSADRDHSVARVGADGGTVVASQITAGHGVTVEEIQSSPDHKAFVFPIPASGAAASLKSTSVVVWVDDDEEKSSRDASRD